jgi:hypothetical protein
VQDVGVEDLRDDLAAELGERPGRLRPARVVEVDRPPARAGDADRIQERLRRVLVPSLRPGDLAAVGRAASARASAPGPVTKGMPAPVAADRMSSISSGAPSMPRTIGTADPASSRALRMLAVMSTTGSVSP